MGLRVFARARENPGGLLGCELVGFGLTTVGEHQFEDHGAFRDEQRTRAQIVAVLTHVQDGTESERGEVGSSTQLSGIEPIG